MWKLYNVLKNLFRKDPVEVYSLELLERDCLQIEDTAKGFRKVFGHTSEFKVVTKEYIAKKHQEISILKNKIGHLELIKKDLSTKQNELTANLNQLTDDANITKAKLRNLEVTSDAQKKNYQLLQQQIVDLQKEIEKAKGQEENYTSLNKNFSDELCKREKEYTKLKLEKATCVENLFHLSNEKEEMLLQLELLKNESSFIVDQLKVVTIQIQSLETENAAIINEYKKYEYLLEIKKDEFTKINDQKKILELTKTNAIESVVQAQGEIDSLNERIASDVKVIEQTVAKNNDLNLEFKEKSQAIIRLMDEAARLPNEIRIYQIETEELNKKLTPIRTELNDLVIKHGAIRSEFDVVHQNYQTTENDYVCFSKNIDDLKTKIYQLETDIENKKKAHLECSARLAAIQREVVVLTQDLANLNTEFGKTDQSLFESLQQFENLTQEKDKLIAEKNQLHVKAIDLTNELATHNKKIIEVSSFVGTIADENQDLGNDVREAQGLLVEIKNALNNEENSFNQLQVNKLDLLENLRNFHEEIASLTSELSEQDKLVQVSTEENNVSLKTIDDLKTKVNQLETAKENKKQTHIECSASLAAIQREVVVLTQDLADFNAEFAKTEQSLFESLQQFENLTQKKEKLIAEKNDLHVKAIDLTNELATHNKKIIEVSSFVGTIADENQDLGNDVREAQGLLVEIKNALNNEENSYNQLQENKVDLLENLRNFHDEIASLTSALSGQDELVQVLTAENIAIKSEYAGKIQALDVRKELSVQLISDAGALAKENAKLRGEIVAMEQEHRDTNMEVNMLAASKEEMRRENILLTDKAVSMAEILTEQNITSLNLQKDISEMQAEISTLKTLVIKSEKDVIRNNDQNATRDVYLNQLNKIKRNLENQ